MNRIINILLFPFKLLAMGLVKFYQICISPLLPHTCRFWPSCSNYAMQVLREFGFFKGVLLATKRICRCRPNGKFGYDPIPANIKNSFKYLV